eukprot:GHVT01092965.1.p2 GENE.GHVT01092965.1~~GHVT01092965.1.p2  ORF type:complete len:174 (-),score=36.94 GHVT01092965.1:937-1458(-)
MQDVRKHADKQASLQKALDDKSAGRRSVIVDGRTLYEWEQTLDDVNVYVALPPGVRSKQLVIEIKPTSLSVSISGQPTLFQGVLADTVDTSTTLWMIEDGELHLQLTKMKKGHVWGGVLQGQEELDPSVHQAVNKKLMLERFQEEHPGFDFSSATFSGQAPDPRTFMGGISHT